MAAPVGNQFWKLRSTHGRDKLFKTPELLWEAACEYFQWCDEHPFQEANLVSFQGQSTLENVPKPRPYTLQGLCLYLDCNVQYLKNFKGQLPQGEKDFNVVISKIEDTVYNQKFSGAAAGFFNSNIIARDLGLADKKDLTTAGAPLPSAAPQIIVYNSAPPMAGSESDIHE